MECKCNKMKELTHWQLNQLDRHLRNNAYYMGEKMHHSVTPKEAEYDFFMNHCESVCSDLRKTFCSDVCDEEDCPLRPLFLEKESPDA